MKKSLLMIYFLGILGCSTNSTVEKSSSQARSNVETSRKEEASSSSRSRSSEDRKESSSSGESVQVSKNSDSKINELVQLQRDDELYQYCVEVMTKDPHNPAALHGLAIYHMRKGRFLAAQLFIEKALKLQPQSSALHNNYGLIFLGMKEERKAMLEFRKAFELDENNIQAGVNLGNYYIRNLDFGKASIAMKGLSSNPVKDWRVMNSYASVLASQKKYSQAKDIYKDILRSQSNQREVLFNYLVLLVDGLKDQDESSAVLQKLKFLGYPDGSQGKMIQLENKIKTGLK